MALLTFLSCRDDQTEQPETGILIEQKEFNVNPQGEIIRVKIKNTKTKPECKISENATDWIQLYSWGGVDVANTSEYTFIYKVLANDGYEAIRSGSIHIKSGSYSDVVNIHQSGGRCRTGEGRQDHSPHLRTDEVGVRQGREDTQRCFQLRRRGIAERGEEEPS